MKLSYMRHPVTLERTVTIVVTDDDILDAYEEMDSVDKHCLGEWSKPNASIEERLMALQLIARKVEEHDRNMQHL